MRVLLIIHRATQRGDTKFILLGLLSVAYYAAADAGNVVQNTNTREDENGHKGLCVFYTLFSYVERIDLKYLIYFFFYVLKQCV